GSWATALVVAGDRVTGVRTPTGTLSAPTVVLAAGVWSPDLTRELGLRLPVAPVKGQLITLRALNRPLQHVIWSGECYLVPKVGGEVILGATVEEGNYDRRPTLAGIGALSEAALEFLPWAGQLVVEGIWAGLRPAAPDRFPIVGRAPGFSNLILATAHFRNGILLGPLTGRWVSQLILEGIAAPELAPFGVERFA
ncbi:MAG TPA: FAD-dependent oxidoreductase, partial [Chloroflexota bacterium]